MAPKRNWPRAPWFNPFTDLDWWWRNPRSEEFKVVDSLIIAEAKTKNIAAILKNFFEKNPNALIIAEKNNKNIYRASKNMKNVKSISADTLNIYDLMRYKTILLEEKALETIKTRYGTV